MKNVSLHRYLRLLTLTLLTLAVLALGANGAAGAAPALAPIGQTGPSSTPTSVPEPSATATRTPTPRRGRNPTATPAASATATATASATPTVSGAGAPNATAQAATATSQAVATATTQAGATATAQTAATATARAGGSNPPAPTEVRDNERCAVRPADPQGGVPRIVREVVNSNSALVLINCPWSVEIDAGDIAAPGALEAKLISPGASQAPNSGERFFGSHVELTLFDSNGKAIAAPTFKQPVQLCFSYNSADLAIIGDPAAFAIELFNPGKKQWERLPSTVDRANSRVCTQLSHLSLYSLAARVPVPSSLPNTGAGEPAIGAWVWVLLALSLGAGASIRAHALRRALAPASAKPAGEE